MAEVESGVAPVGILTKLTDAQAFSRDPEDYSKEDVADTIARLHKHVARQRKARDDEAAFKDSAAKIKKANEVSKKKKTTEASKKKTKASASLPEDVGDIIL